MKILELVHYVKNIYFNHIFNLLLHTDGGVSSDTLQELQVNLISNTDCHESYQRGAYSTKIIGDDHICASGIESGTGACYVCKNTQMGAT